MTRYPSPRISSRAAATSGTGLAELRALARQTGAVDLSGAAPGFPETSSMLVEGAVTALRAGLNHEEPPAGRTSLRRYIAQTLSPGADPDTEITVTSGATEALFAGLLALLDQRDEVIVFTPAPERFGAAATLAGAVVRHVHLDPPEWRWDPDELAAAFNPRTRAVLLSNPADPTGRVLTRTELNELAQLCERWDTTVISDESLAGFVFDGRRHISVTEVPGLAERAVVVGSLSKSHAVGGWRLGFVRTDAARSTAVRRVHELVTGGTAAPLQAAAGFAADGVDLRISARLMAYRRDLVHSVFARAGMKFLPAEGGVFLLADISPLMNGVAGSAEFARGLLERCGVLVAPGALFFAGRELGEQYVRIAFNRRVEVLAEAEHRILHAG